MVDKTEIIKKMYELSKLIKYEFKDIDKLKNAMNSTKIQVEGKSKKKKEYQNQRLAIVGDALLKFLISDDLFNNKNIKTKGDLTEYKEEMENNNLFHLIILKEKIINYAFNDVNFYSKENSKHNQVHCGKHDDYLEAIVGAIYYDGGIKKTKKWYYEWLKPILEKYKKGDIKSEK